MTENIQHGNWKRYVPIESVTTSFGTVMYCKRDVDDVDWYDCIKSDEFQKTSVKMTVDVNNIVLAATRDVSGLFPQDCLVLEVFGDDTLDVQAKYGGMIYDPATDTFSPAPPPVPIQTPADKTAELANERITRGVAGAMEEYNSVPVSRAAGDNIKDRVDRLERTLQVMCEEMMKIKG